jgi:hypothetical protein
MNKRLGGGGFAGRLVGRQRFEAEELIEGQAEGAGEAHMQEVSPRGPAEVCGIIIPRSGNRFGHETIS